MASGLSWEEARDKLKKFRDGQRRQSEEVVDIWESSLQEHKHNLADDVWPIYEQVCIAACDCGRDDIAEDCIKGLRKQFPGSTRVNILKGMYLEAVQKYDAALQLYEKIEEKEPSNTVIRKRRIAILKEKNDIKKAITELKIYLKDYMADVEAWNELCELYLREHDYAKAAFCMEELVLFNPNNHVYFTRYGEIRYTQGGQNNIEEARKYFAHALRLDKNNMRALYGFYLCANTLASIQNTGKVDNIRYAEWAMQQIQQKYQDVKKEGVKLDVVDSMFSQMKLAVS